MHMIQYEVKKENIPVITLSVEGEREYIKRLMKILVIPLILQTL